MRIVAAGNLCVNSIHETLVLEPVEIVRGANVPALAAAHDHSIGFHHGAVVPFGPPPAYLVAGMEKTLVHAEEVGNACIGMTKTMTVDGEVLAFVVARDLDDARAEAAEILR
jgi:hypothetical protein